MEYGELINRLFEIQNSGFEIAQRVKKKDWDRKEVPNEESEFVNDKIDLIFKLAIDINEK